MQRIEVVVRITKDHCPPQEQTIFEWIETNREGHLQISATCFAKLDG